MLADTGDQQLALKSELNTQVNMEMKIRNCARRIVTFPFPHRHSQFTFLLMFSGRCSEALQFFLFVLIAPLYRYYKQGAVSLIAMNLHTNKEVHVILENSLKELDVDEYLFTPAGNITSRFVVYKSHH